jgi:Family of unknown function (DUF6228)
VAEARELKIGHERTYLLLTDVHDGLSTRSRSGKLDSVNVELVLPHLRASSHVSLGQERPLDEYFAELAVEWRAWPGAKEWKTYEGGLVLSCLNDARGHIAVGVTPRDNSMAGWLVHGDVPLDAGQLDELARDMARFVSNE